MTLYHLMASSLVVLSVRLFFSILILRNNSFSIDILLYFVSLKTLSMLFFLLFQHSIILSENNFTLI